jgi:hypothetical protein
MKYFNSKNSDYSPAYASDDYRTVILPLPVMSNGNEKHGTTARAMLIFSWFARTERENGVLQCHWVNGKYRI